jgi:hypothetical protein
MADKSFLFEKTNYIKGACKMTMQEVNEYFKNRELWAIYVEYMKLLFNTCKTVDFGKPNWQFAADYIEMGIEEGTIEKIEFGFE